MRGHAGISIPQRIDQRREVKVRLSCNYHLLPMEVRLPGIFIITHLPPCRNWQTGLAQTQYFVGSNLTGGTNTNGG